MLFIFLDLDFEIKGNKIFTFHNSEKNSSEKKKGKKIEFDFSKFTSIKKGNLFDIKTERNKNKNLSQYLTINELNLNTNNSQISSNSTFYNSTNKLSEKNEISQFQLYQNQQNESKLNISDYLDDNYISDNDNYIIPYQQKEKCSFCNISNILVNEKNKENLKDISLHKNKGIPFIIQYINKKKEKYKVYNNNNSIKEKEIKFKKKCESYTDNSLVKNGNKMLKSTQSYNLIKSKNKKCSIEKSKSFNKNKLQKEICNLKEQINKLTMNELNNKKEIEKIKEINNKKIFDISKNLNLLLLKKNKDNNIIYEKCFEQYPEIKVLIYLLINKFNKEHESKLLLEEKLVELLSNNMKTINNLEKQINYFKRINENENKKNSIKLSKK